MVLLCSDFAGPDCSLGFGKGQWEIRGFRDRRQGARCVYVEYKIQRRELIFQNVSIHSYLPILDNTDPVLAYLVSRVLLLLSLYFSLFVARSEKKRKKDTFAPACSPIFADNSGISFTSYLEQCSCCDYISFLSIARFGGGKKDTFAPACQISLTNICVLLTFHLGLALAVTTSISLHKLVQKKQTSMLLPIGFVFARKYHTYHRQ